MASNETPPPKKAEEPSTPSNTVVDRKCEACGEILKPENETSYGNPPPIHHICPSSKRTTPKKSLWYGDDSGNVEKSKTGTDEKKAT